MCVQHDAAKHGCDHLDAVNRIWIHLKKGRLAISKSRFVINHTTEDAPLYHAASGVASAMVDELRVDAVANVARDVAARSIKNMCVTCLSSCLLVIGDR
ncbi:hypothetical protein TNCV_3895961 [Trichonephila clavipes]|nr:hypothetical protein TNCV_3895961 [Trichonephila clavipes]